MSANTKKSMGANWFRKSIWFVMIVGIGLSLFTAGCGTLPGSAGDALRPNSRLSPQAEVEVQEPNQAVIYQQIGFVEMLSNGEWTPVSTGAVLAAGSQVRTGELSSVMLKFYDGSRTLLGPNAELRIDELQAGKSDQQRVILMTQLRGDSAHSVAKSTVQGSRYEVNTPSANASAKGTVFKVTVRDDQGSRVQVLEGKVAVTGQDVTVMVDSGKSTNVDPGETPDEATFFFSGEGVVDMIGDQNGGVWVVDGVDLVTYEGTVVVGNPQVGDKVSFEGQMQEDNTRLVDQITLVVRSTANQFSITGTATTIGANSWIVNGQEVFLTVNTQIDDGIVEGDLVQVDGIILSGGVLQAEKIIKLENAPGTPFDFTGVVQLMGETTWTVSDIQVSTTVSTTISEGIVQGDLVQVKGWVLASDSSWQADSIQKVDGENHAFQFVGEIESMDPWMVAGRAFETRDWTVIDEGLEAGDQVKVTGVVLEDGTWVAHEVRLQEDITEERIVLVGVLTSKDPWTVNGTVLNVDSETVIQKKVKVGMLVRVEIEVLEDGTWKILRISPADEDDVPEGCVPVTAVVVAIEGNQVQLEGYPMLPLAEGVALPEGITAGSTVVANICTAEDGTQTITSIALSETPIVTETPEPGVPGEKTKMEVCHSPNGKNPHTIVIAPEAVPAHLAHGDTLGTCP